MPAEGRSLCTFSNRDCWQNLSCKLSAALSSSLKKPLTLLIPSPVDTFSKHLLFARIRAGRSSLVNSTLAAILDFFVYCAVILNFTQYALQHAHAPSLGWVGPTMYNGLMTILIDTAERMHELLAHLKELMTAPSCPLAGDLCCFII